MDDESPEIKKIITAMLCNFQENLMHEIHTLKATIEDLQSQVIQVNKRLLEHLDACPLARGTGSSEGTPMKTEETEACSSRRRRSGDHKRECLRKALQQNVVLLVDGLPFAESELGDLLISAECLTEDECCDLRQCRIRRDKTRNLVRLIKGRSFKVMADFLNCINRINPDIAHKVWESYEKNTKDVVSRRSCTFCLLRQSVDIKLLADHLWGDEAISEGLYDEIVARDHPGEADWLKLAAECNSSMSLQNTLHVVCKTLEGKGHYKELVSRLKRVTKLVCRCFKQEVAPVITVQCPSDGCEDDGSSVSPTSSVHLGDVEHSDISSHEDLTENPCSCGIDNALCDHNNEENRVRTVRQTLMPGLWSRGESCGANIKMFRRRSHSFVKVLPINSFLSTGRRASMIF